MDSPYVITKRETEVDYFCNPANVIRVAPEVAADMEAIAERRDERVSRAHLVNGRRRIGYPWGKPIGDLKMRAEIPMEIFLLLAEVDPELEFLRGKNLQGWLSGPGKIFRTDDPDL